MVIYKKDVIAEMVGSEEIQPETKEEKLLFSCLRQAWKSFSDNLTSLNCCHNPQFEWEDDTLVIKSSMPMNLALSGSNQPKKIRKELKTFNYMLDGDDGELSQEVYEFAIYYRLGVLKHGSNDYAFILTEIRQDGELDSYTNFSDTAIVKQKISKEGEFSINLKTAFDALIKKSF